MPDTYPTIEMEIENTEPTIEMRILRAGLQPDEIIDDTAGAGVTDKVWSADKLTSELSGIGVATLISGNEYRIGI